MELTDIFAGRRSYRHYEKKPVDRALLVELIHAAEQAPVSCNLQLSHFVIVDDKEKLSELTREVSYKFAYAPACIVVLYDPRFTAERGSIITGTGMAVENILLRAVDLGLATCPMAGFGKDGIIKDILGVPKELSILLLVAVGYPDRSIYMHSIPKIPLATLYSWNFFTGQVLRDSLKLEDYSILEIINYRRRIAPVYLDRFRLNTFSSKYYDQAFDFFIKNTKPSGTVLDLMSYDGVFLRELCEKIKSQATRIIATDYLENNLTFFKKSLGCEVSLIDENNRLTGIADKTIDCVSFVFQTEFTPKLELLLDNVVSKVKPGGKIFAAHITQAWYRRLAFTIRSWYKRVFLQKFVNVYENNPFYKIGPSQHIKPAFLERILMQNKCGLLKREERKLGRGRKLELFIFEKIV